MTAVAQSAGGLELDWFTIAGGGGASSGGAFSLSGTVGQAQTAVLAGADFRLEGGFWQGQDRVIPGVVRLHIRLSETEVLLSWPAAADFVLEQTGSLPNEPWDRVAVAPIDDGTRKTVALPRLPGAWFYRLRQQ